MFGKWNTNGSYVVIFELISDFKVFLYDLPKIKRIFIIKIFLKIKIYDFNRLFGFGFYSQVVRCLVEF